MQPVRSRILLTLGACLLGAVAFASSGSTAEPPKFKASYANATVPVFKRSPTTIRTTLTITVAADVCPPPPAGGSGTNELEYFGWEQYYYTGGSGAALDGGDQSHAGPGTLRQRVLTGIKERDKARATKKPRVVGYDRIVVDGLCSATGEISLGEVRVPIFVVLRAGAR